LGDPTTAGYRGWARILAGAIAQDHDVSFCSFALRRDLLHSAERLTDQGALLVTARFHDHGRVFRLPRLLARPLLDRIEVVNEIYAELHQRFGGPQVDLGARPGVYDPEFWTVDRLHPSELGHRALAYEYAELLSGFDLHFEPPGLDLDGITPTRRSELRWLCSQGAPWLMRRARDLGPSTARRALWRSTGTQAS